MNNKHLTFEDYQLVAGPDWPDYKSVVQGNAPEFVLQELADMYKSTSEELQNVSNFCVLPFYAKELPSTMPCCHLPKGYDVASIRADIAVNKRNSQCNYCWKMEDIGAQSDRQIQNETLSSLTGHSVVELAANARLGNSAVIKYKIDAGNFCNATCVTCEPGSSSSWGKLHNQYFDQKIPIVDMLRETSDFFDDIDYKQAQHISFTGGEGTMIKTHWRILERLIAVGNTDCVIGFVTNGSFIPTARQMNILKQFNTVQFCYSIDGIESRYEYMRFPLSWNQTVQNIQWAREQGFDISASYTISNLNVMYYPETVGWFIDNNIPFLENLVDRPAYFAPSILSDSVKHSIVQQTQNNRVQQLLDAPNNNKDFKRFCDVIRLQDNMKSIKLADYMPELSQLLFD